MNRHLTDMVKGLLALEGYLVPSDDLDDALASESEALPARSPLESIVHQLSFLGGRPMHAGHNLDLEEPFEQLAPAANDAAPADCAACG